MRSVGREMFTPIRLPNEIRTRFRSAEIDHAAYDGGGGSVRIVGPKAPHDGLTRYGLTQHCCLGTKPQT